jgi:hypothetical protein
LSDNEIARLAKTLAIQQSWLESRGVPFVFTIAPNKNSLYGQYMPDRYIVSDVPSNAKKLGEALKENGVNYVNLFDALGGGSVQLYHKLDTHWNNTGALTAANALLARVRELNADFVYAPYNLDRYDVETSWQGDLSDMLYPSASLLDVQHIYDIDKRYRGRFQSPEDIFIETTCGTGSLDLLMMRDSFTNALILPLSNTFASVTYSRAVPYDYTLLTEETDIVIMEIAERNLPNLIAQAPVMPAPYAALPNVVQQADMEVSLSVEDEEDFIRLSGYALPPDYESDRDYDICIRLAGDGEQYGFMPFPIPGLGGEGYDNAAFSLYIEKSALPEGDYALDILLFDGTRYIADTADAVLLHL